MAIEGNALLEADLTWLVTEGTLTSGWVQLFTGGIPAKTAVPGDFTELSASNYARSPLSSSSWGPVYLDTDDLYTSDLAQLVYQNLTEDTLEILGIYFLNPDRDIYLNGCLFEEPLVVPPNQYYSVDYSHKRDSPLCVAEVL